MRLHFGWLSEALILLTCIASLSCRAYSQYRFTQWTADSGLPQSSVRGLEQTPDGYLWVATLNGLARFDGVRFQVFDKSNMPGIASNRFVGMVRGEGDDLWLASEDGNVIRQHGGSFHTLGEANGLRQRSVGAITGDGYGGVWIESDGKVLRWNAPSRRFLRESFSTDDLTFQALSWGGTGFWAPDGPRIICFDRGTIFTFPMPANLDLKSITGIASNVIGEAWISTKDGRM